MTNGLAVLGGYSILFMLLAMLFKCLLRPNPCEEPPSRLERERDSSSSGASTTR